MYKFIMCDGLKKTAPKESLAVLGCVALLM